MKFKLLATGVCLGVSIILACLGITLFFLMDVIINKTIAATIPLKNGSDSFKTWISPPVPVYMQFWLFNVTNGDEVQQSGVRPMVQQMGPYTYQEHRQKFDIKFNSNGTISYRETKSYTFVPEMSVGDEDDVVWNVNLLLIGVSQQLQYFSAGIKSLISAAIETADGHHVFVNHTVGEWLWGYHDPLVNAILELKNTFKLNITIPLPEKIGLYYGRNGTDGGLYTIYSGTAGVSNFSVIDLWKGERTVSFWNSKSANQINGTDGTSFPPSVKENDKLYVFSSDLCRSIDFVFQKHVTVRDIGLMRFIPPPSLFGNVTENPDNAGFCTPNCLDSGVLNVSRCQNGLPAIMSQPHFFQAAQRYKDSVIGLNPSAELSQTIIDVDPHTGIVLNAAKKLQVNIDVHPVAGFDMLNKVNLFMPLVWVNESARVDEKTADQFKQEVIGLINMATVLKIVLLVLSLTFFLIMVAVTIACLCSEKKQSEESQKLINRESAE